AWSASRRASWGCPWLESRSETKRALSGDPSATAVWKRTRQTVAEEVRLLSTEQIFRAAVSRSSECSVSSRADSLMLSDTVGVCGSSSRTAVSIPMVSLIGSLPDDAVDRRGGGGLGQRIVTAPGIGIEGHIKT